MDSNEVKLDNLPSNSKESKKRTRRVAPIRPVVEEQTFANPLLPEPTKKAVRPVARGMRQKKSLTQSIAQMFVGSEESVGSYILQEVLLPAAKSTIQDMVESAIQMFLYGDAKPRGRDRDRGRSTKISYGSFYRGRDREDDRRESRSRGGRFNLDEITFEHPKEADDVLSEMMDLLQDYEQVTVADFYELAGVDGGTWADRKWGWEEDQLKRAYCSHVSRGKWALILPKPIELD
jgi:hypothetical protein